jgi:hypothetical protein
VAQTFSITTEQREAFDRVGVLRVPGYFVGQNFAAMADAVWADLNARYGVDRARPETWTVEYPSHFQTLIASGAFRALMPGFIAAAQAVLGAEWSRAVTHVGQPLVTFPKGEWHLPHQNWHFDTPPGDCVDRLPIFRAFTFLDVVDLRGGGTVYVEGSHQVAIAIARAANRRLKSNDVRALLESEEPWFKELFSPGDADRERRLMAEEGVVRGVRVKVGEMTGRPGDLIVMHPALIHAGAPNGLERTRLMLTLTLGRRK